VAPAQINKLGSMSNDSEEQAVCQNPVTTPKLKKFDSDVLLSKARHFDAIAQLLQLAVALIEDCSDEKTAHEHRGDKLDRETRKSFDYVDAITNLMVRSDEVVAAVSYGGPSRGIISVNLTDGDAQVRRQYA